jgi:hypothetical protein
MYLLHGENGLWRTDARADARVAPPPATPVAWPEAARSISTMAVHPSDPDILCLIPDRQDHAGELRRSADRGVTWSTVSTPLAVNRQIVARSLVFHPRNPSEMYFCVPRTIVNFQGRTRDAVEHGVYASLDDGRSWQVRNRGLPAGANVGSLAADPTRAGALYAAVMSLEGAPGGLYRTVDEARSWSAIPIPTDGADVNHVRVQPLGDERQRITISCGSSDGPSAAGGLWCSDDLGRTWRCLLNLPYVVHSSSSVLDPGALLAVANANSSVADARPGIYLTTDSGDRWRKINHGLAGPDSVNSVEFDPVRPGVIWAALWGSGQYVSSYQLEPDTVDEGTHR